MTHAITHPQLIDFPSQIDTPRLVLRTYTPGDGQALFDCIDASRTHLAAWVTWVNDFKTASDAECYARNMQAAFMARKDMVWLMQSKAHGALIGALGLHEINWQIPSYSMGWWTAASVAGQGYCKEAAEAVANVAMTTGRAQRLWATCDADNKASEAVMRHIGMHLEGRMSRHALKVDGSPRDTLMYARTGPA
jgi:ribosomal-protein-serine acetyltransferase